MDDSSLVEKSLLEKIQDMFEREQGHDVGFCVGKEKKIVKAIKILLKAASPFLKKEFEKKYELIVVDEGEAIPLLLFPDFDPTAFEIFVKLTSLDMWSLEHLNTLKPTQILNLLSICRRFEMKKAADNLEKLATTFMQSFGAYSGTEDFLQLSQANLKYFLVSDDIGVKEPVIFHCAIRWAEFQCKEMKVEPSQENIRKVLGDCLFEIRFPIMSCNEFTKATNAKDILTEQESLGIYKFIGLEHNEKLEFDTKKLPFKTTPRKKTQALKSEPNPSTNNSSVALIPLGTSTLSLNRDCESRIVENLPFVCDGSPNYHFFACEKKITIFGLGFLGPIENDGFYDVKVHIEGRSGIVYDSGMLEKRISAQKGKQFYFVFDAPIDFEAGDISSWKNYYKILCCLQGPNTSTVTGSRGRVQILKEGHTKFLWQHESNQLVEILFKLKDSPEPAAKVQSSSSSLKPVKPPSDENSVTTMPVSAATFTPSHLNCLRNDSTETNAGADTKGKAHSSTDHVKTSSKANAQVKPIPSERRSSRAKKRKPEIDIESDSNSEEDNTANTAMDSKKRPTVTYQPSCQMNPGFEKVKIESDFIPVKAEPDE